MSISTDKNNVQSIILEDLDFLNFSDLNIVAIGEYATETLINEVYKQNSVLKPILIIWVEPYMQAGQAVLLMPKDKGCFNCLFDRSKKFKYRISEYSPKDTLREAGCQSTYTPYGAIDVSDFTSFIARIVDKIHLGEFKENTLFQFIKNKNELGFTSAIKKFKELENFQYCCEGNEICSN